MDRFDRQIGDFEKEKRQKERKAKWDERGDRFWSAFLFTENGKPKSGFIIYTFCLAIVFFAVYYASFYFLVDLLNPIVKGWPVFAGNLFTSLCCSAVGILIGLVLHRWFSDKRLILGAHIWLVILAVASIIAMAVILKGSDAMSAFMKFFFWFVILPVVLGTAVFYRLYKRDHHPKIIKEEEKEPEYKKYIRRG